MANGISSLQDLIASVDLGGGGKFRKVRVGGGIGDVALPNVRRKPNRLRALMNKRRAEQRQRDSLIRSLLGKMQFGIGVPGEGNIPYNALPQSLKQQIDPMLGAPPLGWDPASLRPRELELLQNLQKMGQQEVDRRLDVVSQGAPETVNG